MYLSCSTFRKRSKERYMRFLTSYKKEIKSEERRAYRTIMTLLDQNKQC